MDNLIVLQEGALVTVIIVLQVIIFFRTLSKINGLSSSIPKQSNYKVVKNSISSSELDNISEKEIIDLVFNKKSNFSTNTIEYDDSPTEEEEASEEDIKLGRFKSLFAKEIEKKDEEQAEVVLVQGSKNDKPIFKQILESINMYLIRNLSSVPNFELLKDIVERNTDAKDSDIRLSLPVPLYLGLMGTMVGIVIGLFNLPPISADNAEISNVTSGIDILMGGVRIAMIASFSGLLLTTLNSGFFYKQAKKNLENKKNEFYSFLQRELLPNLSGDINSNLSTLQKKLNEFNDRFGENLDQLSGLMNQNFDTLKIQEEILEKLEKSDFNNLVKSNLSIFREVQENIQQIQQSGKELGKFNNYLNQVNDFISKSTMLNSRVLELMDRTQNFQTIATQISNNLEDNNRLQLYLNTHFNALEERGTIIKNTVANVDDAIQKSVGDLKDNMESKLQEFKEFSAASQLKMEESFEESAQRVKTFFHSMESKMAETLEKNQVAFQKLNHLEELNEKFDQFLMNQESGNQKINDNLIALKMSQPVTQILPSERSYNDSQLPVSTENQFPVILNSTFQIIGIISFITILFYIFYTII